MEDRARALTLDTSFIVALFNRKDPMHEAVRSTVLARTGPLLIPCGILAEISYLVERRFPSALASFLDDLASGAFILHHDADDLVRASELVRRYDDLGLGLSDALVITCAERHGGLAGTLDRRHFDVVAREGTFVVVP